MAQLFHLSSSNVSDTFHKLVQTEGGRFSDGSGSVIHFITSNQTSSMTVATASYAISASHEITYELSSSFANTASYVAGGNVHGTVSSATIADTAETATCAEKVKTVRSQIDSEFYIPFVADHNASATCEDLFTTNKFSINPSTGLLTLLGKIKVKGSEITIGDGHISMSGDLNITGSISGSATSTGSFAHIITSGQTIEFKDGGSKLGTIKADSAGSITFGDDSSGKASVKVADVGATDGNHNVRLLKGDVTASGNISASGMIQGATFQTANIVGDSSGRTSLEVSGSIWASGPHGHITASIISSSKYIRGMSAQFGNMPFTSGPLRDLEIKKVGTAYFRLQSTDNANQVIEFNNNQEPDYLIQNRHSKGGLTIGSEDKDYILIGKDEKDIITLSGSVSASGNLSAQGNISASGYTYSDRYFSKGASIAYNYNNRAYLAYHTSGDHIYIGKGGAIGVTIAGPISASRVSASAGLYGNDLYLKDQPVLNYNRGQNRIIVGNKPTLIQGHLTASGDISSSGNIIGASISSSGDLMTAANITSSGALRVDGTGSFGDIKSTGNIYVGSTIYHGSSGPGNPADLDTSISFSNDSIKHRVGGSFYITLTNSQVTLGKPTTIQGNTTVTGHISASTNIQATGYLSASKLIATTDVSASGDLRIGGTGSFAGIRMNDNKSIHFGNSKDLSIWHDGSNSYIHDSGTGRLKIKGGAGVDIVSPADESMATFEGNGAVNLYHNNNLKLSTTTTGVTVAGSVRSTDGTDFLFSTSSLSSEGDYRGEIVSFGNSTTVKGILYAHTGSGWTMANSGSGTASCSLAIALGTNSTDNGMLLRGFMNVDNVGQNIQSGQPLYMGGGDVAGRITPVPPGASGTYARVVGYAYGENIIHFCPDNTWVKLS